MFFGTQYIYNVTEANWIALALVDL